MLKRYFPDKQIYLRNNGQVSYYVLEGRTQLLLSIGLLVIMLWCILTLINIFIGHPLKSNNTLGGASNDRALAQCTASLRSYELLSEWHLNEDQFSLIKELERLETENSELRTSSMCNELSSMLDTSNEVKLQLMSQNNSKLRSRVKQLVEDREKLFQLLANKSPAVAPLEAKQYNIGQKALYKAVNILDDFLNGSKVEVIYTKKELTDKVLQATYFILASFLTVFAWFTGLIVSRKRWIKQADLPEDLTDDFSVPD